MMRRLFVVLVIGAAIGLGFGTFKDEAAAQQVVICPVSSFGNATTYYSETSCPIAGSLAESSTLNKWDTILLAYYVAQSTFSGCGSCNFDWAFDANNSGSGLYYVQGTHSVNIPGYSPGYRVSYYGEFTV